MRLCISMMAVLLWFGPWAFAQKQGDPGPGPSQAAPHSDQQGKDRDTEAGESSSRDTRVDLSPPKNDVKDHPNSAGAVSATNLEDDIGDVHEMHPWNPYRALKDDEVGDFYFKRKNYRAALARYQDAVTFKEHDAVANFGMGQCYEKLNQPAEAVTHYKEYLKILPHGPLSSDARKALERLGAAEENPLANPTQAKQ
jgi:tetratricopeptide (TPR) repeat protein